MLKPISSAPKADTYHRVKRARRLLNIFALRFDAEYIAFAAPRMNQRRLKILIDLLTQPPHININDVGKRVEVFVPDVFGDVAAVNKLTGVQDKEFQQGILF